jgi:hypothetical protein
MATSPNWGNPDTLTNGPEVATVVDDVRYCGKSGLSADVEFSAESDPMLNSLLGGPPDHATRKYPIMPVSWCSRI